MRRLLAISLVIVMSLSLLFTGCGSTVTKTENEKSKSEAPVTNAPVTNDEKESNLTEKGTLPIVKEKVKLSVFVSMGEVDTQSNLAVKELEKRTNIDLDIVTCDPKVEKEKVQILMNTGSYPEVFLKTGVFKTSQVLKYGALDKIIIPLNDLIKENCVQIPKLFEQFPEYKKAITAPNGNIYGLTALSLSFHGSMSMKMYMNYDWIKKLGFKFEYPNTTEEFYQVLKAFKEKDPNGNGKQDEIPLSGAINWWNGEPQHFIMNAFIYDDASTYLMLQNGELKFVADKPEWKEGLKYLNKLYKEKLMDPASFTQNLEQLQAIGQNKDGVILGTFSSGFNSAVLAMDDSKPEDMKIYNQYQTIPPLKGPAGYRVAVTGASYGGDADFVIMDTCKNPEVAIRLADYMCTEEGTMLTISGPEGVLWEKAGPDDKDLMGRPAKMRAITYPEGKAPTNVVMGQGQISFRGSDFDGLRGMWASSQDMSTASGFERRLFKDTEKNYLPYKAKEVVGALWFDEKTADDLGQLQTLVKDHVYQSMLKFITGELNIDSDWDGYIKQLKTIGVDKYLDVYQKALKASKTISNPK